MELTKILLLICLYIGPTFEESIIMSDLELDFGTFYQWNSCSNGSFAYGFEIKAEDDGGLFIDDEAMTGARIHCRNAEHPEHTDLISSFNLDKGVWKGDRFCESGNWLNGFRIRVEPDQGWFGDDTAANDLEMSCTSGSKHGGGGTSWGTWSSWVNCPEDEVICGLVTKVEDTFLTDSVGLVAVRMKCCPIPVQTTEYDTPTQVNISTPFQHVTVSQMNATTTNFTGQSTNVPSNETTNIPHLQPNGTGDVKFNLSTVMNTTSFLQTTPSNFVFTEKNQTTTGNSIEHENTSASFIDMTIENGINDTNAQTTPNVTTLPDTDEDKLHKEGKTNNSSDSASSTISLTDHDVTVTDPLTLQYGNATPVEQHTIPLTNGTITSKGNDSSSYNSIDGDIPVKKQTPTESFTRNKSDNLYEKEKENELKSDALPIIMINETSEQNSKYVSIYILLAITILTAVSLLGLWAGCQIKKRSTTNLKEAFQSIRAPILKYIKKIKSEKPVDRIIYA